MQMTAKEYDEMFAVLDEIDGVAAEYPSLKDLQELLMDVDKTDVKYLMWLDEHLPTPETDEQDSVKFIIKDVLKSKLTIEESTEEPTEEPGKETTDL